MNLVLIPKRSGLALGLVALMSSAAAIAAPADLVLYNAKVLTVDEDFAVAQAVAIKDGIIIAVGGNDIQERYEGTTEIDLGGRTVMPGFIDTHVHMHPTSHRMVVLDEARSIAEVQAMVRAKAEELGPGEWITGRGWDEALLKEQRNIVRGDIDAVAPNNPVMLTRAGGHSSVGNTMALKVAGITRDTPDPEAGLIERDEQGEPNGIIRERSDLYRNHVPADNWEALKPSFVAAMQDLLRLGVTSFHSASTSIDDEPVGLGGVEKPDGGLTFRRLQALH
ncbi:MAG: amidohydrolase, partial [Alphaproteobacteria bacterium]